MTVAKAAKKVFVYTQQGSPLGLVDPAGIEPINPDDLNKVQTADDSEQAKIYAQAAKVQAQSVQGQQQAAAEEVGKAMGEALAGLRPRPGHVAKSMAGVTVDDAFKDLVKSLDASRGNGLKVAVSVQSVALMKGQGLAPHIAIGVCKRTAVRVAQSRGLI